MGSRIQVRGCKSQDDNHAAKRIPTTNSGWSSKIEESKRKVSRVRGKK